ncbi:ComEC/Rec2 family competence protein [Mucilaginibacter sp.]|uniref:ComEC/Rec2 family competence protein n=1 Tax=Mucilaginibacter sp. TaxID=1882438 RepID=UPI00284022F5|nr:ComEC/Rec2 family competence protein [Mucilaginibacter sp.]MDR3694018.1 ComEC/Rec2 family competence protein [Mucilaginibacter sp.]
MIPNHKGEIPVVMLLLPFLSGIVAGLNVFAADSVDPLIDIFVFFSITFILLNLNYSRLKLYKYRWLGGALIGLILFLFGCIISLKNSELNAKDHFSKRTAQYLVVKINNEPVFKNELLRFTAKVEATENKGAQTPSSGTLLVTIKDSAANNLYYGDELLIPAKYKPIDPPFNPAEFNYKKYLACKNVYYQAFIYPKQYKVIAVNTGNPLIAHSLRWRQHLVEKLTSSMRDTGAIAVASTLILGYKADLSGDILQAYKNTGTVYVLSVSGSQVAILYLVLSFALQFLNRHKYGGMLRASVILAVIWYYAMLTGFSLAVCRADVMLSLVIIGKSFRRYINTLNLLAVSAFLLLIYDPFFITEAGFQLSFIAVSGLIVLQPVVYQWLKFKNKWADKVWALCSVSITAQVVIFPISAFYFHQFPVYFLISNLFVAVPAALVMYGGILFLLLPQIPVVSASIAFILEKTIVMMNKGLACIEHAPYAVINKIWLTGPEYVLVYVVIISLFYFLFNRKLWLLKFSMVCMLMLCISLSIKNIGQSMSKEIVWLNLKKHQGIVFKNGNKAVVLTDLKSTDKTYLYSVQPYLDSCQVNDVKLYNLGQDVNTNCIRKKHGLVQFLNTTVFIPGKELYSNDFRQKIKTNYIYVTGNPDNPINGINRNFVYAALIIDGSNSDAKIEQWKKQLKAESVSFKILKRNNSIISVSK